MYFSTSKYNQPYNPKMVSIKMIKDIVLNTVITFGPIAFADLIDRLPQYTRKQLSNSLRHLRRVSVKRTIKGFVYDPANRYTSPPRITPAVFIEPRTTNLLPNINKRDEKIELLNLLIDRSGGRQKDLLMGIADDYKK